MAYSFFRRVFNRRAFYRRVLLQTFRGGLAFLLVGALGGCFQFTRSAPQEEDIKQEQLERAQGFAAFTPGLTPSTPTDPAVGGRWGEVIAWPFVPTAVGNLPDNRVVSWASWAPDRFGGNNPNTSFSGVFDPKFDGVILTNNKAHDMFCAGTALLEGGQVFASGGGRDVTNLSLFDTKRNSWASGPPMNRGRWYNTNVYLPSGQVFTALGRGGAGSAELWTPDKGWRVLSGADLRTAQLEGEKDGKYPWYPWLHVTPSGELFHSGPTPTTHLVDPSGSGSVRSTGTRLGDARRVWGNAIMYDVGKLLITGGRRNEDGGPLASAFTVDVSGATPVFKKANAMRYERVFHQGVMLPTGEDLVIGGNTCALEFCDDGSQLVPEIWNPATGTWREAAAMSVPRNYHGVSILLQDGRVLSAGGGLCGNCATNHPDGQIFSPPYLFNKDGSPATRPEIRRAPDRIRVGERFTVKTNASISKFSMIKLSTFSHGLNTDLRYLPVAFERTGDGYALSAHANPNVLVQGYYWLFATDAQGVPSVGHLIQVRPGATAPPMTDQAFTSAAVAQHSDKCLNAPGETGAQFVQQRCNGGVAQRFTFTPVGGRSDVYTVRSDATDLCLGVAESSGQNRAAVIQTTCQDAASQQFTLSPVSGKTNTFQLIAKHSGKAVDVERNSRLDGAPVLQWTRGSGTNQQWKLPHYRPAPTPPEPDPTPDPPAPDPESPTPPAPQPDGPGTFASSAVVRHSGKCLSTPPAPGAQFSQAGCDSSAGQRFTFTPIANAPDTYTLSSGDACLTVADASRNNRAAMVWQACGGKAQQFRLQPVGNAEDKVFHLIARHSGKAVDVERASQRDGAPVLQWTRTDSTNQHWHLAGYPGSAPQPTPTPAPTPPEPEPAPTPEPEPTEPTPGSFTSAAVVQHSGKCLNVSGVSGEQVVQRSCNGGAAQQFTFTPSGAAGSYTVSSGDLCLGVTDASRINRAAVVQQACDGSAPQRFKLQAAGSDTAFLLIAQHSGKAVDVERASRRDGAPVLQWTSTGSANQRWTLAGYPGD